jgi:sulfite exporter TauE/SafE
MLEQLSTVDAGTVGLGVFFAIGLLGGAHCIGMCGPLVTSYATRLSRGEDRTNAPRLRWHDVRQHALFNLGRTVSYAAIGAVMGALGALLFDAAAIVSVARSVRATAGVLVGGIIVLAGVQYLVRGTVGHVDAIPGSGDLFERLTGLLSDRIDDWVDSPRIFALGAIHGVLPCPLLYPAFLYAFARGSPVEGALSLAALGLGTFPTLFGMATVWHSVQPRTRVRLHRVLGVLFVLLGSIALTHGLMLFGVPVPHVKIPVWQPLSVAG